MRIFLDLDSTINNLIDEWVSWYNKEYSQDLQIDNLTSWDISKFEAPGTDILRFLYLPGSFSELDILPDAEYVIEWLMSRADVYIVSSYSGWGKQCEEKVWWVRTYLPFFPVNNLILCHQKYLLEGDYMVDDGPHNLQTFTGTSVVFDRPWNRHLEYPRVFNWRDVQAFFSGVFYAAG